jgi:hypothetical protein
MKLLLIAFLYSSTLLAQTIPLSRTADWSKAGYPSAIPSPSIVFDVTQFGAVGDGITDDYSAIRSAIDSLHGTQGVVYFPAGTYLIGSSLDLPDSVILRGESSDSTRLTFNFNGTVGNCINITGSSPGTFTNLVSDANRGELILIVDSAGGFAVGDYAELLQNNGSWDTQPAFWADNSVGQILKISNVSGDTLFFDAPLRINYDTSLQARVRKIIPATEVGVECMEISRTDNVAAGVCYNIWYNYAANCWIRGVESNVSIGSHVEIDASTNISIRGSYFHHSYLYDGVSTHGYGITLFSHTGQCLIENNIMQHLRHSFSLQTGANGNVIAYNYSIDPNRSEAPANFGADISMHGHYPFSNLFEGNIVQNIQLDYTHGPNGPFNTFFRNRAELYGLLMTSGAVQSDSQNFVGNEIPGTPPFFGFYTLTGSGHFEFGNNIRGTVTPSGSSPLPDSSNYLSGIPAFFTSTLYPTIGIPNAISTGTIPARDRFLSGHDLTDCDDEITLGIKPVNFPEFKLYPNPANNSIHLRFKYITDDFTAVLKDLNGKEITQKYFSGNEPDFLINVPEQISEGIYILEIIFKEKVLTKKVVISQ